MKDVQKQCAEAVDKLIEWQGSPAELARVAALSRVAVFKWRHVGGRVSESAAVLLAALPGCPLTAQQIRPDLPKDFVAAFMTPETKKAIKVQATYIKKRDAEAARLAKAAAKAAAEKPANPRRMKKLKA